jgi:hypothetical protein
MDPHDLMAHKINIICFVAVPQGVSTGHTRARYGSLPPPALPAAQARTLFGNGLPTFARSSRRRWWQSPRQETSDCPHGAHQGIPRYVQRVDVWWWCRRPTATTTAATDSHGSVHFTATTTATAVHAAASHCDRVRFGGFPIVQSQQQHQQQYLTGDGYCAGHYHGRDVDATGVTATERRRTYASRQGHVVPCVFGSHSTKGVKYHHSTNIMWHGV